MGATDPQMSYQVLARKWRPRDFDEVTGQPHVTRALRNAIRTDRVPHAILLTGPRGVGKTTIARILARGLNCDKGPTDKPCNQCIQCEEISRGHSRDVQEIDAASHTSVDDVREIIESIRYSPTPGKTRIYVVDEVHMLSTAAFNALLKTLEEPPPRSLFILATTNPEKIPYTVLSRCQRYDLRRLPVQKIAERLREVADSEKVEIAQPSLLALARASEGSLRDALTLFDQLLAGGETRIEDARVGEILDLIDREVPLAIAEACISGNTAAALEACRRAEAGGIEPRRLGGELLSILRDLVVLQVAPETDDLVDAAEADLVRLKEVVAIAEPGQPRRMFRTLIREQEDLAFAPDPFAVIEMAVVRLATLADGEDVSALLDRLEQLELQLSSTNGPSGSSGGKPSRLRKTSSSKPETNRRKAKTAPSRTERTELQSVGDKADPGTVYDRLRNFAQQQNRGLFAGLDGGEIINLGEGMLRIALPEGIGSQRIVARKADLEGLCERFFGRATQVELELRNENREATPPRTDPKALRETRRAALQNQSINEALEILDGEIVEIRPLGGAP